MFATKDEPHAVEQTGAVTGPNDAQLKWDFESEAGVAVIEEDVAEHPLPLQEHLHQLWLALGLDDE